MATLETVVAMALRHEHVMDELGPALREDIVTAHPFLREIASFADDFLAAHRKLPSEGDFAIWLDTLPHVQRDGCKETLGRLWMQRLDGHDPAHFAERVLPVLRQAAAKGALSRLNSLSPDQVLPGTFEAVAAKVAAVGPRWAKDPDLPGPPEPDSLPVDVLPDCLREWARTVSDSGQVPMAMPVVLGLAAVSAAAAGKAYIRADASYPREWLSFFGVIVAKPAERKSYVFSQATEPIREWERLQRKALKPKLRLAQQMLKMEEKKLAKMMDDCVKGQNAQGQPVTHKDVERVSNRLERLRSNLAALPCIVSDDITPEAILDHMIEQDGRIAIMSPEGGPLRLLDGRYSEGSAARLEELAKGYDGEAIRNRRKGKDPVFIPCATITLGVAVQPSVLETLRNVQSFVGQGIFGRVSWTLCPPRVGTRVDSSQAAPLDPVALQRYRDAIERLLAWQVPKDDDGMPVPQVMGLSPAAQAIKQAWHDEIEPRIGEGGDLSGIADWAGKAVGRAMRIAALLELARRADHGQVTTDPISGEMMEAGVAICRSLMSHTRYLYARVQLDDGTATLIHVWERVRRMPPGTTVSNVHQRLCGRRGLRSVKEVEAVLDELEARGLIRCRPTTPTGRAGRPPSPVIELHPDFQFSGVGRRRAPVAAPDNRDPDTKVIPLNYGKLLETRRRRREEQVRGDLAADN